MMLITPDTNFCRVFELPESFSSAFCFGGGIPTTFTMVDWFRPIGDEEHGPLAQPCNMTLAQIEEKLRPFLKQKRYIKPGRAYLVLYAFGAASVFRFDAIEGERE